jgi:hypothetical protein
MTETNPKRAMFELVIHDLIQLLQHSPDGLANMVHQEPMKGRIFNLFFAAYNSGLLDNPFDATYLNAERLADVIAERAPEMAGRLKLNYIKMFWREWTYAWTRHVESQKDGSQLQSISDLSFRALFPDQLN